MIRIKESLTINLFLKTLLIIYLWSTAFLSLSIVSYGIIQSKYKNAESQITSIPLGNSFIYKAESGTITDQTGKEVISGWVRRIGMKGNTIYGYTGNKETGKYFICTYDEDCSNSRNYSANEFEKLRKEKGFLPLYYFFFDDRVTLILKEWIKRKITFQETPPSPFFENPEGDKIVKNYLLYTTELLVNSPLAIYLYIIFFISMFSPLVFQIYKAHKEEAKANAVIELLKNISAPTYVAKHIPLRLAKTFLYILSLIGTFLLLFALIPYLNQSL